MNLLEHAHTGIVVDRIEGHTGAEVIRGRRVAGTGHALFHTDYAVRCVHHGELQLRYRGQEWRLPPGSAKIACPGEVTVVVSRPEGHTDETQLFVEPETFHHAADACGHVGATPLNILDGRVASPQRVHAAVGAIADALERNASLEAEDALVELVRIILQLPPAVLHRKSGIEPRAVRAMRELLVAEYARNVTLDELAKEAGMSKYYSAHLFKSYVGVSPHRFVTGVRVAHARQLLRRAVSCGKVAEYCGFSDQSHMTRHFTRLHEISPSRYARGGAHGRRLRRTRSGKMAVVDPSMPVDDVKREIG